MQHELFDNNTYDIWIEGWAATGDGWTPARRLGQSSGNTFEDACVNFMRSYDRKNTYYNPASNSYWGCGLYDNESDARRNFG